MSPSPATAILVAGMHRSGTSATAGALKLLGVDLGTTLLEPGQDNPRGYWENRRAVEIHERLLGQLGRSWYDVRALPEGWADGPEAGQAVRDIEALVDDEFSAATVWAVKDPRISRLLPVWLEALERAGIRPVVLVVARHPAEVAASIHARNSLGAALSEMLWLRHVTEAEQASRSVQRSAITYDAILADPVESMSSALSRLGIPTGAASAPAKVRRFIHANDRHHDHAKLEGSATRVTSICVAAYAALESIAAGEDAWGKIRASAKAFNSEWSRWGAGVEAVAEVAAKLQRELVDAEVLASRLNSELQAQIQWGVSATARHDALETERARLQSELTAQLRWSESAVLKQEATEAERARVQSELTAQLRWADAAVENQAGMVLALSEAQSAATQANEQILALDGKAAELEAALAQSDSKLIAQVRWSEEAVVHQQETDARCAQLQSDLTAQIEWSEMAVVKHEAIEAERARLASELTAQVEWSKHAVEKHEAIEVERARLASELRAQIEWSKLAVEKHEAIEAERARLASELAIQLELTKLAVGKHEQVASECARLTSELGAETLRSEAAESKLGVLETEHARLGSQLAGQVSLVEAGAVERSRLAAGIAMLQSELAELQATQARTTEDLGQSRQEAIDLEAQRQVLLIERANLQERVATLDSGLDRLQKAHDSLLSRLEAALSDLAATSNQLGDVLDSRWWKLGRPFRAIAGSNPKYGRVQMTATAAIPSSVDDADATQNDKVRFP